MKIIKTDFGYNYHSAQKVGRAGDEYVLHNIDVFNKIVIDNQEFFAVYQPSESYYYNDYKYPNPNLELSEAGGAHEMLVAINSLVQSDLDAKNYDAQQVFKIAQEYCSSIKTFDDLQKVYDALNDNVPILSDFIDDEQNDLENYVCDEKNDKLIYKL